MRVGAFELEKRIGAGGMGQIWQAKHLGQGLTVAVKFDLHAPDSAWRDAFLAEVRRIAEIDHTNVVHLFDTGIVTEDEAEGLAGIVAGMPWLAMELARGGAVADEGNLPSDWHEVRHVVRSLLMALAASHAVGIIHRDIKPGNLLLAGPRSSLVSKPRSVGDARVVLSDFGIGHDRDRPGWMDEQSVGTPRFMAPEQIEAHWRDQGPWTDLYQTGIMLWRLTTGRYPFEQKQAFQLYRAHLMSRPPRYEPCMDVPPGLEELIRDLLKKDWRDRPAFASDVLQRLDGLGEVARGSAIVGEALTLEDAPTVVTARTEGNTTSYLGEEAGLVLDMGLRSAGLGLWGLRPLPLVGRTDAREVLWDALVQTKRRSTAHLVVVRGAVGVGKSRILQWLTVRAHERGIATSVRANHHETVDDDHGLFGMFHRELRLGGLEREDAAERIIAELGFADSSGGELLCAWLLGPSTEHERAPSKLERWALLQSALGHMRRGRALIFVCDDAHYGKETLEFVRDVLKNSRDLPVLCVVAAREDLLAERADERALLEELLTLPSSTSIDLGPLCESDHRTLVRKMLGLEGQLAAEVERRTAGNPAFAEQLVHSWVEGGKLIAGPSGFRHCDGVPEALPKDLLAMWDERVGLLLKKLHPSDREAVELAAVLGHDIELQNWRAVCELGGVRLRPGLVGVLVRMHLLGADTRMEQLWFTHSGIREALLSKIRREGREGPLSDLCATLLLSQSGDPERLAGLLIAAGRLEEAIKPLLLSIERKLQQGDLRSPRLLEILTRILGDMECPKSSEHWGHLWLNWAWFYRLQGDRDRADRYAARVERAAEKYGWRALLGWALREAGTTAIARAEYEDAVEFLTEAHGHLTEAGRPESAAFCRMKLGDVFDTLGEFELAEREFRSCLHVFDAPKAWVFAASPWLALAQIAQKRGQLDDALEFAEEARWRAERVGQHSSLAHIALLQGEVARYRGDLETAEAYYRESMERYDVFHDKTATVPALNLGVVGVLRAQYAESRALMDSLLQRLLVSAQPVFVAYARAVLIACCAALGDTEAFYAHFDALEEFLNNSGLADPDILKLAEIAEKTATDHQTRESAATLVASQRRLLG